MKRVPVAAILAVALRESSSSSKAASAGAVGAAYASNFSSGSLGIKQGYIGEEKTPS